MDYKTVKLKNGEIYYNVISISSNMKHPSFYLLKIGFNRTMMRTWVGKDSIVEIIKQSEYIKKSMQGLEIEA